MSGAGAMEIREVQWDYVYQHCVLAQSTNKQALEQRADLLRAEGYATEIQPSVVNDQTYFYSLLATRDRYSRAN